MSLTRKLLFPICIAFLLSLSACVEDSGDSFAGVGQGTGTGTALVSWFPPTENVDGSTLTDLAGYRIYYGNAPGDYDNTITIGNIGMSSYLIENMNESDWYFVMTAFNAQGVESAYSTEVHKNIE